MAAPLRRVLGVAGYALGGVLIAMGVFAVGAYVVGVVDILVEKPADRSWLFWGAGLAMFGLIVAGIGVGLVVAIRLSNRKTRVDAPTAPENPG